MDRPDPKTDALMAPEASPWAVSRLNNAPIYIVLGIGMAFAATIAWVAIGKARRQTQDNTEEAPSRRSTDLAAKMALSVIGDRGRGVIPAKEPAPRPHSDTVVPIAAVDTRDSMPPRPPQLSSDVAGGPPATLVDSELQKERLAELRRALSAPTKVEIDRDRDSRGAEEPFEEVGKAAALDPAEVYERALQLTQETVQQKDGVSSGASPHPSSKLASSVQPQKDRFRLDSELEAPQSPFIIQAGSVLPATLVSAVNSELPGPVIAQVAQPVFDSPTGRALLIPQGAKLYGEYSSDVVFGQSRLMIAWQRIAMPDGATIDIGAMPGADGLGRAGFEDEVDNHYFRLFASALLLSGVTAGVAMSQETGSDQDSPTAGSAMSQALGQQLGTVTAGLIQKNMNAAPTLHIRPGYRFNVIATKDIVLPPRSKP